MRTIPTVLFLFLAGAAASGGEAPLLLRMGKVFPVAGPPIDRGELLIRGKRIEAVGRDLPVPEGARVVELRDFRAYPGLVDLHCHIAGGGGELNDVVLPTNPELRTLEAIVPGHPLLLEAMREGITTVNFIPGSGSNCGGLGTLLKTGGGGLDRTLVRFPGTLKIAQAWNPERGGGDLGASRMGGAWGLRKMLESARHHHEAWTRWEEKKTGPKPPARPDLDALRGLFRREFPVIVHTAGARDVMQTARMLHDEFRLWVVVTHGCFNAHLVAGELAKRDLVVNLGPRLFDFTATREGRFFGIATEFRAAGVKSISIDTDSPVVPQDEFWYQGAMAVRFGFPEEEALRAVTLEPARQVGIEGRVGSLAADREADVVIKRGSVFEVRDPVEAVLINGEVVHDRRGLFTRSVR